ncbi:hypothetical protein H6G76_16195 [Nostoc sp. FACHB-152]|uniref:hypothetical protein n=1 Tax=unclassified Nostoc TaxID=2593658 RepID=UPI001685F60C|nr:MULTISPECIES: hypothetical protein [unclassified Nostoc]MBD2448664.1 hypothetical protein [Nostoc sp. FACHB-152]MBD2468351.1 hypothetical protein [Nostoc sp. FACHB-145]
MSVQVERLLPDQTELHGWGMDNPILIHASTTPGTAFGDPRLIKRGQHFGGWSGYTS